MATLLDHARRHEVREALWSLVNSGTFAGFDEALAAYTLGHVDAPTLPPIRKD